LIEKNTFLDFAKDALPLRRNSAPMCLEKSIRDEPLYNLSCPSPSVSVEKARSISLSTEASDRPRSVSVSTEASDTEFRYLQDEDSDGNWSSQRSSNVNLLPYGRGAYFSPSPLDSIVFALPYTNAYPELDAEQLSQQAKDLKMQAKELEVEAWKLRNPNATTNHWANVGSKSDEGLWTTVMLRNIPNNVTRAGLLDLLMRKGFSTTSFNFVYLLMDFKRDANLGYAFVDLVSAQEAHRFFQVFQGFQGWGLASGKVGQVCWGNPLQGVDEYVERYRNSPVMHSSVPDEHKPMLFLNGARIQFPGPTKKLRAPRAPHGRIVA